MLTIGLVAMGVDEMARAVAFWSAALDYRVRETFLEGRWTTLEPVSGTGIALGLMVSETAPRDRPRLHLDLDVADAAEQAAEVERLVGLGATVADWDLYPPDPDFVVLVDTEGNHFCIVDQSH